MRDIHSLRVNTITIKCCKKYTGRRIKANRIKEAYIGQGLPELTPVEIVGYEVDEAGSPLALANG